MSSYDLTQKFHEDVKDLIVVAHKIIDTNELNKDFTTLVQELAVAVQKVEQTQLQQEEFDNTIKEVLGYDKRTNSNFC